MLNHITAVIAVVLFFGFLGFCFMSQINFDLVFPPQVTQEISKIMTSDEADVAGKMVCENYIPKVQKSVQLTMETCVTYFKNYLAKNPWPGPHSGAYAFTLQFGTDLLNSQVVELINPLSDSMKLIRENVLEPAGVLTPVPTVVR
jgi:hypothetical protein